MSKPENVNEYLNNKGLIGCLKDYEPNLPNPKSQELFLIHIESAKRYGNPLPTNPRFYEALQPYAAELEYMCIGEKTPEQAW